MGTRVLLACVAISLVYLPASVAATLDDEAIRGDLKVDSPASQVLLAQAQEEQASQKPEDTPSASVPEKLQAITVSSSRIRFKPEESTSATKFPLKLIETPQAVSVVPASLLRVSGAQSIGDAGDLAPGIQDGDRDISAFADLVSRGFRVNFFQGYKINGLSIVNEGFQLDPYVVDRVEFVRGPSSIIYGQSDYGLTVNSILKQPQATGAFGAQVQWDEFGTVNAGVDFTGPLTGDGNLLGRVVVSYLDTESFQDFAFRKQVSVAPSLTWRAAERTTVSLQAYYADTELRDAFGFPLATDSSGNYFMLDVPKDGFWSADWKRLDGMSAFGELRVTHRFLNDMTLDISLAEMLLDRTWQDPYAYAADATGATTIYDYMEDRRTEARTIDATLHGNFEAFQHTHTFMLNVQSRDIDDRRVWGDGDFFDGFNLLTPDPTAIPRWDTQLTNLSPLAHHVDSAVSGMLLLRPFDRLSLMLGGRFNRLERTVEQFAGDVQTVDVDFTDDEFTSRFAATYELVPSQVFAYASYSEGLLFQNQQTVDGNLLGPEVGQQIEIGVKADLLEGRLGAALAAYQLDRTNVAAPDPNAPNFYRSISGQVHEGIELELIGQPVEGLNVLASYAYTDVSITESANPAEVGQARANTPKNLAKFFVTWEPAQVRGLSIGGGVFYRGEVEVDNVGSFQFPSYTRLDLTIGYQFNDKLKVALIGQNVTDENIIVSFADSADYGSTFKDGRKVMLQANWGL